MSIPPVIDQLIECPICTKVVKEPKILPCFHSYCLKCLEELESTQLSDVIICPVCHLKFIIPQDGVKNFPNNNFIKKICSAEYKENEIFNEDKSIQVNTKAICVICEALDIRSEASFFCVECDQAFCTRCGNGHTIVKFTANHHLTDIPKITNDGSILMKMKKLCQSHNERTLDLYCKLCNSLICVICYKENHLQHDITNIENLSQLLEKQLYDINYMIKDNIFKYEVQLTILKDQENKFISDFDKVSDEIYKKCENVMKIIQDNKNSLLEKLNFLKEQEIKRVLDLSSILKDKINDLSKLINICEKQIYCDHKIDFIKEFENLKRSSNDLINHKVEDLTIKENFLNYIFCDLNCCARQNIEHILGSVIETKNTNLLIKNNGCDSLKCMVPHQTSQIDESKAETLKLNIDKLDIKVVLQNKLPRKPHAITSSNNLLYLVFEKSNEVQIYDINTSTIKDNIHVPGLNDPSNIIIVNSFLLISEYGSSLHRINWKTLEFSRWSCRFYGIYKLLVLLNDNIMIIASSINEMAEYNNEGKLIKSIKFQLDISDVFDLCVFNEESLLISYVSNELEHSILYFEYKISIINYKGQILSSFVSNKSFICNLNIASLMIDNITYCLIYNFNDMCFYTLGKDMDIVKGLKYSANKNFFEYFKFFNKRGDFKYLNIVLDNKNTIYIYAPNQQSIVQLKISADVK